MFPEKRRSQITSYLRKKQHVSVNELSKIFNVHKVTIRNDLKKLQDKGILIRTHGGAVVIRISALFRISKHKTPLYKGFFKKSAEVGKMLFMF